MSLKLSGFYRFNLNKIACRVLRDLCQILGMFSLNSIGCVTKCSPAGILEGNTTDRCMLKDQRAQIFIQKDLK